VVVESGLFSLKKLNNRQDKMIDLVYLEGTEMEMEPDPPSM
jgi:hypothetical protein